MKKLALIIILAVFVLSLGLRMYDLDVKPLHHDEGVNGHFMLKLQREGIYRYDPSNYHGPFFYYATLGSFLMFGLSDFSLRFMVALFGSLIVLLMIPLRKYIGDLGSIFAAIFLAVSPGFLFYSRYAIHEIFFLFFTLGCMLLLILWLKERRDSWFYLFMVCLALSFSVKETAYIFTFILLTFLGIYYFI